MNLIVKQSASFKKTVKKLSEQQKKILDDEVVKLMQCPLLGELKKGDLNFLRVHKFKFSKQELLLGYMHVENEFILTLLKLGVHENFYRNIKKENHDAL